MNLIENVVLGATADGIRVVYAIPTLAPNLLPYDILFSEPWKSFHRQLSEDTDFLKIKNALKRISSGPGQRLATFYSLRDFAMPGGNRCAGSKRKEYV